MPCLLPDSEDFHSEQAGPDPCSDFPRRPPSLRKISNPLDAAQIAPQICTAFGHPAVERLHSYEKQADKLAQFQLTIKIERVKP